MLVESRDISHEVLKAKNVFGKARTWYTQKQKKAQAENSGELLQDFIKMATAMRL